MRRGVRTARGPMAHLLLRLAHPRPVAVQQATAKKSGKVCGRRATRRTRGFPEPQDPPRSTWAKRIPGGGQPGDVVEYSGLVEYSVHSDTPDTPLSPNTPLNDVWYPHGCLKLSR